MKQKIMYAALGLAVLVFVADRIIPGGSPVGPQDVQASMTVEDGDADKTDSSANVPSGHTQVAEARTALAMRLDSVARSHHLADKPIKNAFLPSAQWVGPRVEKAPEASEPQTDFAELKARKAREFVGAHRLQGVIVAAGRSMAIIDGNCISIGQKLGGFELKSVTSSSAVLSYQDVSVVLNLTSGSTEK
ncbi:MAG: hypothetical protein HN350_16745 [Phycisphaerales bacterium]|nr:hypothetical protein [Phycisphaerales bacterium]